MGKEFSMEGEPDFSELFRNYLSRFLSDYLFCLLAIHYLRIVNTNSHFLLENFNTLHIVENIFNTKIFRYFSERFLLFYSNNPNVSPVVLKELG